MRKLLTLIVTLALVAALAACGGKKEGDEKEEVTKLTVGASNVPHAEILEEVKPILKEQNIDLEIVTFQDYVVPNKALEAKELDANYFQHIPYLEGQINQHGYDFEIAGSIHIEPLGIYSQQYDDINDLPDGSLIIMSNSVADHGRILAILEKEGILKLDPSVEKVDATIDDIIENPKNLKFETDLEPGLLPKVYNNKEGDAVAINSNYAIDAGLKPLEDAIVLEETDSPYLNVVAVRKGDKERAEIKALIEVLQSKEISDFIYEKYEGAVVPVAN